jgi:hypothetical protein
MKKAFIALFIFFRLTSLNAQELKERSEDLGLMFNAKYFVLKSDKKIKEGLYSVFNNSTEKVVARGNYKSNQQIGNWLFFDAKGNLEQRYDFDNKKVLYNYSTLDSTTINYQFPLSIGTQDSIYAPIKIGGLYYGYSFLLQPNINIATYLRSESIEKSTLQHILEINKDGYLTSWIIKILENGKLFKNDLSSVSIFSKSFIPAKLNGVNTPSIILFNTITIVQLN